MNRCAICNTTDEDNPKASISYYDIAPSGEAYTHLEPRCLECHNNIQENLEDLSIADEEFEFADNGFTTALPRA